MILIFKLHHFTVYNIFLISYNNSKLQLIPFIDQPEI